MTLAQKARSVASKAELSGSLIRPKKCEKCKQESKLVAHHDDYSRPLFVRWLCRECHSHWHAQNGKGANSGKEKDNWKVSLALAYRDKVAYLCGRKGIAVTNPSRAVAAAIDESILAMDEAVRSKNERKAYNAKPK